MYKCNSCGKEFKVHTSIWGCLACPHCNSYNWYSINNQSKFNNWYTINNQNNFNKMGLTEKFLSSLKKEPEKSFRKAGITNGDDIPTDEGVKLICTMILQKNEEVRKELIKIAKDISDDEKEK
jgi:hypothetical protein